VLVHDAPKIGSVLKSPRAQKLRGGSRRICGLSTHVLLQHGKLVRFDDGVAMTVPKPLEPLSLPAPSKEIRAMENSGGREPARDALRSASIPFDQQCRP